ncbi:MAG TPA: dienelactone hydrolase family protein [Cyclobacteriaceae bacterium]|nr:dienelactone hydrolase family protein [Cyclobacteriaceae bacterium]HPW61007.1 dienelactone hydrolase family protein [Cyclobacteriaceae bacterium]
MKAIKLLLLFVITSVPAMAQIATLDDGITICHTSPTEKFALFVQDDNFNMSHPDPLPYVHQSEIGKMVTFKTADGKDGIGYVLMAAKKTNNWIFVFQEWWGLNDHIKRESEKLYNDLGNVNVLAIDMYDGKLATTREDAGKYMGEFKQDRGNAIVKGAITFAGKNAKIGTIGWCFGGGQSMQASLIAGKQAAACVIYYGMPETDVNRLKNLNTDVLNIWPTQDQWINKEVTDKFEANMKEAGKKLTTKAYDADHAFANPSNPKFNPEFTADAYKSTLEFFKARLK